jgi:GxxExxY protein
MSENEISRIVYNCALTVHRELGPGFLESVYEEALAILLVENGLKIERQKSIPVTFRGKKLSIGFRADIIVEGKVIIELKSVEVLHKKHFKTVLNYLKASNLKLGLLINFNAEYITDEFRRIVNNL